MRIMCTLVLLNILLGASQLPHSCESAGAANLLMSTKQTMLKATITVHFRLSGMY